ncbi:hypothetical protein FOF52_15885 [Thermobifida alba]|uniref:PH domain-containing protein n=1 Tax=Thermobifida alba TaxID=53522 RepID=A0ABY4L3J7_THEAE|nr:hypothetical protein [Thermobifida alba]UPT22261.1 hypothetical protein FOF52_15885 [Thermobifida alba]HLU96205.1 hypothetical protein [Thermobifida alba]
MSVTQKVRLTCPLGRKHVELWGGAALAALGGVVIAMDPSHWASVVLGVLVIGGGLAVLWHGLRAKSPVLEIDDQDFCYIRGRYVVRVPFSEIGSYYLLPGRTRSLGLCDPTGRPKVFPSVEGRRAGRPYLPLTGLTSPAKVDAFMSTAGIPPRDRSLTSGS